MERTDGGSLTPPNKAQGTGGEQCTCELCTTEYEDDAKFPVSVFQQHADALGIPGPNVGEHPEDYYGECYCWDCLEDSQ